jgi:GMP synthase-like glutamine amidotransferase
MTTSSSTTLLDPAEALPDLEIPSPLLATPRRQAALVVQERRGRPASAFVDVLLAHDLDVAVTIAHADSLPDPGASPLAILVGSEPLSVARASGRLQVEVDWIGRADAAGASVLGVGHGARALALAFGGDVTRAQRPLRGWAMVDTTVPHLVPTGPWLSWQHDVISLPAAAEVLAHNLLGPQAFRLGRHLGVQFHPEATPETIANWATSDADRDDVGRLLSAVTRDEAAAAASTWRLLSSFIDGIESGRGALSGRMATAGRGWAAAPR